MPKSFVRFPFAEMRDQFVARVAEERPGAVYKSPSIPTIAILDLTDEAANLLEEHGATVYSSVRFEKFGEDLPLPEGLEVPLKSSLQDVLKQIQAPLAWRKTTGSGATIVIIDSGVVGERDEFEGKRSTVDIASEYQGAHWHDESGHGTMCAAVSCGRKQGKARYNGVAPEAKLLSARTSFDSDDIYLIYDEILNLKRRGSIDGPIVVNNSYGTAACDAEEELPSDHPFLEIVQLAVNSGVPVVFAAGNNHVKCSHEPSSHEPNTIWGPNSVDEVLCVGAVDWKGSNTNPKTEHCGSSRGPGQWSRHSSKPDCVAPCYGEVPWGHDYMPLPWWGTSGAAPLVSGLLALLYALSPGLPPRKAYDIVKATCARTGGHEYCTGAGIIDCAKAVDAI